MNFKKTKLSWSFIMKKPLDAVYFYTNFCFGLQVLYIEDFQFGTLNVDFCEKHCLRFLSSKTTWPISSWYTLHIFVLAIVLAIVDVICKFLKILL